MKKRLCLLLLIGTCLLWFSCNNIHGLISTESPKVTDITRRATFEYLRQQGYMGGSIQYVPNKPSAGHLAKDVTVGIRLGKVTKEAVNDNQYVYTDIREVAEYGSIFINDISEKAINFDVKLYSALGDFIKSQNYVLEL